MHNGPLRTLLLILLLAFAGFASAVPCAEPADMLRQGMESTEQGHCEADKADDCHGEHRGDCGIECGCCPGLSNSLAAVSDPIPNFSRPISLATTNSVFKPSPDPESALRPPIAH
ncbi:hypothetical protein [Microbulbifer variabilis]|uniref:hypothetical protein n=1 Tax=Microbulbifer variabilis TaxID=266805 RepID=UPI001CFD72BD|nr:hypothetical protein [Microbulbifer variabilis]